MTGIGASKKPRGPGGVQGESPWEIRPTKAKAVCRHCLQILTAETIKI